MTDARRSWDNRARAESFGAGAERYDALRPRYADEVVDRVLTGAPASPPAGDRPRVLDIGTGTGILARQLRERGAEVTGSEVDAAMAAVARRSGLRVVVGRFEDLDLAERFDRVTSGQSWHWVDPEAGLAAARRLLAPRGQLWLLWNLGTPEPPLEAALDAVYARITPGLTDASTGRDAARAAANLAAADLARVPGTRVTTLEVRWRQTYSRDDWIALQRTHSDHAVLPDDLREEVLAAVGETVDAHGGAVTMGYTTHAVAVAGLSG